MICVKYVLFPLPMKRAAPHSAAAMVQCMLWINEQTSDGKWERKNECVNTCVHVNMRIPHPHISTYTSTFFFRNTHTFTHLSRHTHHIHTHTNTHQTASKKVFWTVFCSWNLHANFFCKLNISKDKSTFQWI